MLYNVSILHKAVESHQAILDSIMHSTVHDVQYIVYMNVLYMEMCVHVHMYTVYVYTVGFIYM